MRPGRAASSSETPQAPRGARDLERWFHPEPLLFFAPGCRLYIVMISLHGLVRGYPPPELGKDPDTGGQVKYVIELAKALAEHPGVARVDLLTRLILDPKAGAAERLLFWGAFCPRATHPWAAAGGTHDPPDLGLPSLATHGLDTDFGMR